MNRLRKLFFKIHRSKGSFQVYRWKEEEELVSVHIRRCLYTWLSLVISFQVYKDTFLRDADTFYEPIMLIGFVILYHVASLKKGNFLKGVRAVYLILPLFMMISSSGREQFLLLAHEGEITLADHGFQLLKIGKLESYGMYADLLIVAFMLWFLIAFYEIGRKHQWVMILIPVCSSFLFYLLLGWKPSWWFFPLLAADTFMFIMPSMAAWGILSIFMISVTFIIHMFVYEGQYKETAGYRSWNHKRYGIEKMALPDGDMSKAALAKKEEQVALTVSSKTKKAYYLKGFVGTVYDGEMSWTNDRSDIRKLEKGVLGESEDIMEYLHNKGFYGSDLLISHKKVGRLNSYYLSIENVGASRKYIYLPYENKTEVSDLTREGVAIHAAAEELLARGLQGKDHYRILASDSMAGITAKIMDESDIRENLQVKSYQNRKPGYQKRKSAEEIYDEYIHRVCLALPRTAKDIIAEELEGLHSNRVSPQGAYATIKAWILKNIKYTDQAKRIPEGKDFLTWFLKETKEGNDVYIASCGTMMFRLMGIPARYVEGYLYQPSSSGDKTEVLQSDAHAWVEIYIENLGWIPVELSEGYMDKIPSYLPDYQGVINGDKNIDSSEDEEKEKEKEESESENLEEEQQNVDQLENAGEEETAKQEKRARGDWKEMTLYIFKIIARILGSILALLAGLVSIFLIWRLGKHYVTEYHWKRSIQASVCVTEWYRHLMMELYLLEKVKDVPFDDWDNRNHRISALLLSYHTDCDKRELSYCTGVYQRALFGSRMISWKDRKRFVKFMHQERKILRKQLSTKEKLRLILSKEFN